MNWDDLTLDPLADVVRRTQNAADAEKTIWGFERALAVARVDPDLLNYLLVGATCLLARADESTPREVLDAFFRRAVNDEIWRREYAPLLD